MKLYGVTAHAVDQAVERLGRNREHARNEITQLMQVARYQGEDGNGRIFDHIASRTRLILDRNEDRVITVYSMDSEKPPKSYDKVAIAPTIQTRTFDSGNAIIAAAHATIQRELAKARRSFTSELRKLKIEQAELGVEIARATVNKVRCMAPHTQLLIQQRIDAMQTYYDVVSAKIAKESAEYSRMKSEAQQFIGMEVSV